MERSPALQRKLVELTRHARGRMRKQVTASRAAALKTTADPAAKMGYLRETAVFVSLSPAEQTWLAESTTMITCEQGRVFYTPNEPGEVVFLLKRGKVDLYRLAPDGRKLVVSTLGPHTIFGEMGLIGQAMYGCFAEAATDCLLCVLSRADLQALIRRNPDVGLNLLAELGRRLQQREEELEALAFRGLPVRLATLLLREADAYGTVVGLSHQDLAERLGTYRETVSQLLGRFRHEGLVAVEPRRIRLLDRTGLAAYAET
ncbi:MAG TPA: Crp/Fnr family transcriptional regulator [Thermomicrobiales bacterium]|nr:Crp/Fnr family transcriptional regulator [Thermomicrobiales bacterium]